MFTQTDEKPAVVMASVTEELAVDDGEAEEDQSSPKPKLVPIPIRRATRVDDSAETEAKPPCVNCSSKRKPKIPVERNHNVRAAADIMHTPIWKPFAKSFAACRPSADCQPAKVGVHRPQKRYDSRGRVKRSCHYTDRAIDVGAMVCGGRVYLAESRAFIKVAECMRPRIKTLFRQANKLRRYGKTAAHYDHAHFSLGCYGGSFR